MFIACAMCGKSLSAATANAKKSNQPVVQGQKFNAK
jgi:hypothetical protein